MEENKIKECIVKIKTNDSHGTGFFIDINKILTCFHVIKDTSVNEIQVNYNGKDYSVEILDKKEEFEIDLAMLKVEVDNKSFLKIDSTISDEDKLKSYGFANSEDYFDNAPEGFERGCVPVTLDYEGTDDHFMKFKNGQFEKGHSGSPIINLYTQSVCGVLNISRNPDNNLGGYGIPIEKLKLLNYKKNNTIEKHISLKNGKSLTLKFVEVKLEEDKILYVGKYPVTFEEYDLFCEENSDIEKPINTHFNKDYRGRFPVINISWDDANQYTIWLSKKLKLKVELPSKDDWIEIANRNKVKLVQNKRNIQEVDNGYIGYLGIVDMYGNIYQWCSTIIKNGNIAIMGSDFNDNVIEDLIFNNLPNNPLDTLGFRIIIKKININSY